MAEIIYKRISDLDVAAQPLGGSELAEISQGGVSKKVTLTNIFGSGWWAALRAAFSAFVAPEATHAVDSDTLEGESAADFHDSAQLVGAIPLANIPVELTGINAATATVADDSVLSCGVDLKNGENGSYGSFTLEASETLIIPKGLYMMNASPEINIQIKTNSTGWAGTGVPTGLILSDGINYRAQNYGTLPQLVFYRKIT